MFQGQPHHSIQKAPIYSKWALSNNDWHRHLEWVWKLQWLGYVLGCALWKQISACAQPTARCESNTNPLRHGIAVIVQPQKSRIRIKCTSLYITMCSMGHHFTQSKNHMASVHNNRKRLQCYLRSVKQLFAMTAR